jgi:hypothetical protein
MPGNRIIALARGVDRRSTGRADKVAEVAKKPVLFQQLIAGLWDEEAVARMRSADAAEKVTRKNYGLLASYRKELLSLLAEASGQEARWHLAVMVRRLPLSKAERKQAVSLLQGYLEDRSSIVKTFALHGLADLAAAEPSIRETVIQTLQETPRKGTAAMKARSKKLLRGLEND